jgi:predicted enzyme related to lactoylglutathione lyase
MPERTSYQPGTPSWVDLATSDPEAAKAFYAGVFGWAAENAGPVEETGGYAFFTLGGLRVAGVSGLQDDTHPTAWSTYVSTDDLDALTARAQEAGAMVLVAPMEITDAGRMAYFAHPAAGMLGAWEPGTHVGAGIVNEPGSMTWNELHTRDLDGAKAFGEAVFGWKAETMDFGGMPYTLWQLGEDGVGGMAAMPPGVPDAVPAYWLAVFAVDDCDAAVERAQAGGGATLMPPTELEGVGRFAVLSDPQGAQFGLLKNAPPPD